MILDEPNNFIDIPSLEWLEKYLMETWKGGYLIVSHDREFLDETCTSVIDMLGVDGVKEYAGSYSYSVAEKAKYRAIEENKFFWRVKKNSSIAFAQALEPVSPSLVNAHWKK